MNISLKPASRGLTVVASLLCLGGILSFIKSDEKLKPLALNIILTTGTVAVGSQLSGKWYEDIANNQLADITSKYDKEWKTLNSKHQTQSKILKETQTLKDELQQDFAKAADEIILRNQAIELLRNKLSTLTLEFQQKTQELDRKLATEDTRFDDLKQEFKQQIINNLNEKLYQVFNNLSDSIAFQLEKIERELSEGEYSEKHDKLSILFSGLDDYYQSHCNLLKNISDIDGSISEIITEVIAIYSRMTDEQSSLKVRYRNLLNVDERRALEDAYTTLADINKTHTPITKAKDLLGEYNAFQKNQLNNLGEKLEDNVNSLEEMRGQVFDLIAQIEQGNLKIAELNNQIVELKKPLTFAGTIDYAVAGNSIIGFYHKAYGYRLDAIAWQEAETGYTLTFATSRNKVYLTADMLHDKNNREQLAGLTNALTLPTFTPNYQSGLMTLEVVTRKPVKKVPSTQELKVKDILSVGNKRSYLITGHPGAGKTSVMIYLGQQLGGADAMRVALNPHLDTKSSYDSFGFVEINNLDAILEQISLIYGELKLRRDDPKRRHPLVICIDELSAVLDAAEDAKEMMEIIRQIAVEGRKLSMVVIVGSHSQTTKAIDMDAEFRNAFYQVFLVGAARYAIEQPHRKTSLKPQQEQWIKDTAYPALLLVNGQYSLVKHPTHGDYDEYKDEGNYPENLEDWDITQLSIAVSNLVDSEFIKTQLQTHDEPKLTETSTHVHNQPISRHNQGSGLQPNTQPTQDSAKKGGSSENQGSTPSKTHELLISDGSGFSYEPQLTLDELELINKNSHNSVATVVGIIWGIKPSKSSDYQQRKNQVEAIRNQSKGAK